MKTRIMMIAVLAGFLGYPIGTARPDGTGDGTQELTDLQAVQALRDLGLPPETILNMVREQVQASAGNETATATPVDTGIDAASGVQEMTDEQAVQALRDLGLAPTTILAMIRKQLIESIQEGVASTPGAVNEQTQDNNVPNTPVTAGPGTTTQTIIIQNPAPATVVTQPTVTTIDDFIPALAAHGVWIIVQPYGRVWMPLVTVVNRSWRPYYDDGSWEWTDDGWCWRSTYSWGWAPFHYGRWTYVRGSRWVWVPDVVWAPSWVHWRYSDAYVGWAPLPPEAFYSPGLGFRYRGEHVSWGCDFGLTDWHYSFVPAYGVMERNPRHIGIPREHARRIYSDTVSVQHTHTTRSNVTLPTLPREVVSNAGRRTDNLRRIVTGGPASAAAGTSYTAPAKAGSTSYRSVTTRNEPATVISTPNITRQGDTTANNRSTATTDRRTSAIREIAGRNSQNTGQPAVTTPAAGAAKPNYQPQPKSVVPRQERTSVETRPAPITTSEPRRQTGGGSRTAAVNEIVRPGTRSSSATSAVAAPVQVRQSGSSAAQPVSPGKSGTAKESGSSGTSGSRSSRLQSLVRDR